MSPENLFFNQKHLSRNRRLIIVTGRVGLSYTWRGQEY